MFEWLRSIWRSRAGRIGTFIVLFKPVYEVISLLGNLDFVLGYVEPVLGFLDSIWGTFSLVLIGFVLIYKASREQSPEENAEIDSEQQKMEWLRSENKQLKIEKSRLEGKLKAETDLAKATLPAIKPISPSIDLSSVDSSFLLDAKPLDLSKPTGMTFFIEESRRLKEENEKVKTERDALKKTLEQSETQKSDGASDEEDE